jgi:hypothetical protein
MLNNENDTGGFKKAKWSADFPVRSNHGTFNGSEKFCNALFCTLCGLESQRAVLESSVRK